MPDYQLQCITKTVSGVAEDYATNTLYVTADDPSALALAVAAVGARYSGFSSNQPSAIVVALGGLEIKTYDMADPKPRQVVSSTSFNLSPVAGDPLPTEVALVLSYRAAAASGTPVARRRGRIYLPFLTEANSDTTGRPSTTIVNSAVSFGALLLAASVAAATWNWVQHSTVDGTFTAVNAGFVDNEWDTQRRRGRKRTSRSLW
jgi:hypothetical protein